MTSTLSQFVTALVGSFWWAPLAAAPPKSNSSETRLFLGAEAHLGSPK